MAQNSPKWPFKRRLGVEDFAQARIFGQKLIFVKIFKKSQN